MTAFSSRAVSIVIGLILVAGGAAYYIIGPKTTAEIEQAYASARNQETPLFKGGDSAATIGDGPFHLAIRYGQGTLQALIEESVGQRMASGPPTGDMGDKISVSPLKVRKVEVGFPEGRDGIMKTTVFLKGTMSVDVLGSTRLGRRKKSSARTYQIRPVATVSVKMGAKIVENRPALVVDMKSLDSFQLNVQDPPAGVGKLSAKILPKIKKKIEKTLLTGSEAQRIMSLPEKLGKGDLPVRLIGAGITIIPGKDGEMFLGLLTNLDVEPQVTAESRGAPLGDKTWGLTIGENTLGAMLRAMAQVGKIPTKFGRTGDPDPEGNIVFQIQGATLSPDGFVMKSRLWNLGIPAFWQDFDVNGTLKIKDGKMTPSILGMTGGEGGGNTWVGSIIEKQQKDAPKSMATGGGKSVPPQMPLPMSGGKRVLQLNVEDLVLMDHFMTVLGTSEVLDAPPEKK